MNQAEGVIKAFGGATALATATGWPVSTVHSWLRRGAIPDYRRADILAAAARRNVVLPPEFAGAADAAAASGGVTPDGVPAHGEPRRTGSPGRGSAAGFSPLLWIVAVTLGLAAGAFAAVILVHRYPFALPF